MKPLIVGEAPSKAERTARPCEGRIGRRLAGCCGISYEAYLETFDRVNLLAERQDTAEHGFQFDRRAAYIAAMKIIDHIDYGRTLILLGKRVAGAFGVSNDYFEPLKAATVHGVILVTFYVVPHPSGVNRWWNEVENLEKMNDFMRRIVAGETP